MAVVELPNGLGKATLRHPQAVTERARRPITRLQMRLAGSSFGELLGRRESMTDDEWTQSMRPLMADDDQMGLLDELNDAIVAALTVEVSLADGSTVPVETVEDLLDLPGKVYDALRQVTAEHVAELMPSFVPDPDPDSPTPPSAI